MSLQKDNFLYVVATPIGNLKDITLRAIEILADVDLVVSEHVRKTRNLLKHYGIKNRVISYREENALQVIPQVLEALGAGRSLALVAEAGTPGVSDPGRRLVDAARSAGFRVVPIPGASAVVAALSVAGMNEPTFAFEGFLPRRSARRKKRLSELAADPRSLVFFEAPHRLVESLKDMLAALGDRRCLVAREMTKIHETITTGRISDFVAGFAASKPRGEFVIVCEGSADVPVAGATEKAISEARALVRKGMKKFRAARTVARQYGLKSNDLYRLLMTKRGDGRKGDNE